MPGEGDKGTGKQRRGLGYFLVAERKERGNQLKGLRRGKVGGKKKSLSHSTTGDSVPDTLKLTKVKNSWGKKSRQGNVTGKSSLVHWFDVRRVGGWGGGKTSWHTGARWNLPQEKISSQPTAR